MDITGLTDPAVVRGAGGGGTGQLLAAIGTTTSLQMFVSYYYLQTGSQPSPMSGAEQLCRVLHNTDPVAGPIVDEAPDDASQQVED